MQNKAAQAARERRLIDARANKIQSAIDRILLQIEGLRPQDGLVALIGAMEQAKHDFDRLGAQ